MTGLHAKYMGYVLITKPTQGLDQIYYGSLYLWINDRALYYSVPKPAWIFELAQQPSIKINETA